MIPNWQTIDELVEELGHVCASEYELRPTVQTEALSDRDVKDAIGRATTAVTAVLSETAADSDAIVVTAWRAIARAEDAIGHLRETAQRARALRDRALELQEQCLRRRQIGSSGVSRPAARATDEGGR